jgi:hypothetical protein
MLHPRRTHPGFRDGDRRIYGARRDSARLRSEQRFKRAAEEGVDSGRRSGNLMEGLCILNFADRVTFV